MGVEKVHPDWKASGGLWFLPAPGVDGDWQFDCLLIVGEGSVSDWRDWPDLKHARERELKPDDIDFLLSLSTSEALECVESWWGPVPDRDAPGPERVVMTPARFVGIGELESFPFK